MSKTVLRNPKILVNGVDLSNHCSSIIVDSTAEQVDTTTYPTAGHREYSQGANDATISASFYQDYAAASVHQTLAPIHQDGTPVLVVVIPDADTYVSTTNPSYMMASRLTGYQPLNGNVGAATELDCVFRNADPEGLVQLNWALPLYIGNATSTEFTGESNIPVQIAMYFGNAGGQPVTGRPQASRTLAKYFEPTTADSAQGSSTQATLVTAATAKVQTFPVTGDESDAIVQANWDAQGLTVGHSFVAEAQGTGRVRLARPVYVAAKAAKDAASVVDDWVGVYVEDPATGSAGTITNKAGIHSEPRIQTEASVIIGSSQATIAGSAAIRGTTLHIAGTNTTGNPAVHVVKKSGSNDDIAQFSSSGAQPLVRVNGNGQLAIHAAGGAISYGSAAGAMMAIGNITTAPTANYSGGSGGFLYVESGALKFRGGTGTITTIGPA